MTLQKMLKMLKKVVSKETVFMVVCVAAVVGAYFLYTALVEKKEEESRESVDGYKTIQDVKDDTSLLSQNILEGETDKERAGEWVKQHAIVDTVAEETMEDVHA